MKYMTAKKYLYDSIMSLVAIKGIGQNAEVNIQDINCQDNFSQDGKNIMYIIKKNHKTKTKTNRRV